MIKLYDGFRMNQSIYITRAEERLTSWMEMLDGYRATIDPEDRKNNWSLHEMYKGADKLMVQLQKVRAGVRPPSPHRSPITACRKDKTWNGTEHTCCHSTVGWRHKSACSYLGDGSLPSEA